MKRIALVLIVGLSATVAQADEFDVVDYGIFRSIDPLAQRDEWGTTHQTPHVNATDFAPRYSLAMDVITLSAATNWFWIRLMSVRCKRRCAGWVIIADQSTAYLRRKLSYAIARLQKNYSMRVTGTLTTPVRRALHMP